MSCVFAMAGPAQADITNTATAQGTSLGQPVFSAPFTVNVPVAPTKNAIGIVKTGAFNDVNANGFADVNDTVTYAFTVTNLGTTTLGNVSVTDNKIGAVTCVATTLIPNQATTCTGPVYHLLQADIDAGSVSNQATATAKAPDSSTVTDLSDPTTPGVGHDNPTVTPLVQKPIVGLVKTAAAPVDANTNGVLDAGDTIAYSFKVTNLGNQDLNAITVADSKVQNIVCPAGLLAPGASIICSGNVYAITQADMDAGKVTNQATATATTPSSGTISDLSDPVTSGPAANAPTVTPLAVTSSMTVAKLDTLAGPDVVGTLITYKFTIKNTGTVTLHNITLSDAGATASGGPIVSLAPGAGDTTTFTASHALVAADIAAGTYTNTATATATPAPPASTNITANGSATTTLATGAAMTFTKSGVLANGTVVPPKAGDKVNYTLVVTNTGATPLYNVSVSDPLLASAATSAKQMVALLDLAGNPDSDNLATAAFDHAGSTSGIVAADNRRAHLQETGAVALADTLSISRHLVRMSGATGDLKAGEKIGFLYSITNPGKDAVSDIAVTQTDSLTFGGHISLLGAGETDASSMIFTRELTPEDIAAGAVVSNGYISSTQQGHDALQTVADVLPLSGIKTYDDIATASISPASDPQLNAGLSYTFTAPYTLLQSDIDAGTVHNLATATAKDGGGASLIKTATFDLTLQRSPQFGVVKTGTITPANGISAQVGDVINYKFAVTNLGNVTLTNVGIADAPVTVSGGPIASLAPGVTDSTTITAQHPLTQADIDAGKYQNQATLSGNSPLGVVTPVTSDNADPTQHRPTITPIAPTPAIGLLKQVTSVVDTNHNGMNDVGDVIQYKFTVYNLGNVTLSNINIADKLGAAVQITGGPIVSLAPNATSTQITGSYPITQADVDAGHVDNTATATGFDPTGKPVSHDSDPAVPTQSHPTIQPLVQQPQAALYKKMTKWDDVNNDGVIDAGDVLHYTFIVANPGNVTLTNLQLTDTPNSTTGPVSVANQLPGTSLAPGATNSNMFTYAYTVTAADETAGAIKNRATVVATQLGTANNVNATSQAGDPSSSTNTTTDTTIQQTPLIAIQLLPPSYAPAPGNTSGTIMPGDILTYKVKVKNMGAAPLNNFILQDDSTGVTPLGTLVGTLLSGQEDTTSFTATYALKSTDIAAGFYNAQVKITANDANIVAGPAVTVTDLSDPSDYSKNNPTQYFIGNPAISVVETFKDFESPLGTPVAAATGVYAVYTITVTNTGNVAFDNVTIVESGGAVGNVTGSTPFALAVGATDSTHFQVNHLLTNADMTSGQLLNQVLATGVNTPKGLSATADSDPIVPLTALPAMAVVKSFTVVDTNGNGIADAGDTIKYTFTVVNTGNINLTNVTIVDPAATFSGPAPVLPSLPVGASDTTTFNSIAFTATHLVTPADAIAGFYSNQATFTSPDLTKPVLSDKSDLTATSPKPTVTQLYVTKPVLTKVAARGQVKRGDVVPYTITASNLNGGTYQLADIMPPGFHYVGGSSRVNGAVVTPILSGVTLTFNSLTPSAGKIILTLNLTAQASLSGGQFVNNARLIDQTSNAVLAVAQATVEVIPEATFDCSDIIGRVFDDVSGDGYMRDGYQGLAGVRIATANGTLVTTDAEGRFHVPCAAIPDGAIGSNFIMKIDPRTLPQGYKITTENPRVVRVTRGKMTEINFGATKIHEVKVDITGRAFDNGSADLNEKWSLGVDRLVDILRKRRSDLHIVYHQGSESGELAQARVDAVAVLVKQAFASAKGGYALDINANVEPSK